MLLTIATMLALALTGAQDKPKPEATSLLGVPLYAPPLARDVYVARNKDLEAAQAELAKNPASVDAAIWLGRRTAYLGRYRDAIGIFTEAIATHPSDARLYRHRGHRYITVREFDNAIADLKKAASLVEGKPDEVEPDGQPNVKNIPTSTLKTNIYYHLGLAYYLKGDFGRAVGAYNDCYKHSKNDDMRVATTYWHYLAVRRLGLKGEQERMLDRIKPETEVIENGTYLALLRMFKDMSDAGRRASERSDEFAERRRDYSTLPGVVELQKAAKEGLDAVTFGYGLAAQLEGLGAVLGPGHSRPLLERLLDQHGATQWAAFGYIAAEADLVRLRR